MIEHPVDKAYRAMNEARDAVLEAEERAEDIAVTFAALLLDTLKVAGYDARAYGQGYRNVYVKVCEHTIEVWFSYSPRYSVRFRSTDTMWGSLVALLPAYKEGIYPSSIVRVIDALQEIDTTIRTYEQCTTCHYSSVGAMGRGNDYYCGVGAIPVLPQCTQYRHYPMQALVSWI